MNTHLFITNHRPSRHRTIGSGLGFRGRRYFYRFNVASCDTNFYRFTTIFSSNFYRISTAACRIPKYTKTYETSLRGGARTHMHVSRLVCTHVGARVSLRRLNRLRNHPCGVHASRSMRSRCLHGWATQERTRPTHMPTPPDTQPCHPHHPSCIARVHAMSLLTRPIQTHVT